MYNRGDIILWYTSDTKKIFAVDIIHSKSITNYEDLVLEELTKGDTEEGVFKVDFRDANKSRILALKWEE